MSGNIEYGSFHSEELHTFSELDIPHVFGQAGLQNYRITEIQTNSSGFYPSEYCVASHPIATGNLDQLGNRELSFFVSQVCMRRELI